MGKVLWKLDALDCKLATQQMIPADICWKTTQHDLKSRHYHRTFLFNKSVWLGTLCELILLFRNTSDLIFTKEGHLLSPHLEIHWSAVKIRHVIVDAHWQPIFCNVIWRHVIEICFAIWRHIQSIFIPSSTIYVMSSFHALINDWSTPVWHIYAAF